MTTHQEALEAAIAAANFSPVDPEAKAAMVAAIRAYLTALAPADNGLVAELRARTERYGTKSAKLCGEAADTITAQAAEIERLKAERDELRAYAFEATKAITNLTIGGSEFFGKRIGEMYTADLPYCVKHIQERMGYRCDAHREKARAEAAERLAEVRVRAPEGMVLVPVEPTPEMLGAFWRQKNCGTQQIGEHGPDTDDYSAYRAMLTAAQEGR